MKYIATVITLILMIWTWSLATEQRAFSLEMHKQVEAGVEQDIRAFIQRKYPMTSDIYCVQLYTEVVSAGVELLAHFRCHASGPLETASADQGPPDASEAPEANGATDAIDAAKSIGAKKTTANEAVEQIFEGYLKLKSDDGFQTWSETGGEIRAPEIRFQNGMRISSSPIAAPDAPAAPDAEDAHEDHDGHDSHTGHQ
jgi:hypothetical protein